LSFNPDKLLERERMLDWDADLLVSGSKPPGRLEVLVGRKEEEEEDADVPSVLSVSVEVDDGFRRWW
jgi:hypothetical protein